MFCSIIAATYRLDADNWNTEQGRRVEVRIYRVSSLSLYCRVLV